MSGIHLRTSKPTLTPIELDIDDALEFTLESGETRRVTVRHTSAEILEGEPGEVELYGFSAVLDVDGELITAERVVPDQGSFYEPIEIGGMRIWLDAVSDTFVEDGGFLVEKDLLSSGTQCRPNRKVRLAVCDAGRRICPDVIADWYPNPDHRMRIEECYRGEDTWMGPYEGHRAHGGLDVNMPAGTPLRAPIDFDTHFLFHSVDTGQNNNRWRGIRHWPDGSVWCLQVHHVIDVTVPQHRPLARGTEYATAAGVLVGAAEHSHFVWKLFDHGDRYFLDPWIFFWQAFRDNERSADG